MSLQLAVKAKRGYDYPLMLDVSNVNPIGTFRLLYAKHHLGIRALAAKATEGSTFKDETFHHHRALASRYNLAFLSYLFLHDKDKGDEAKFYLDFAKPWAREMVAIDAEFGGLDSGSVVQMAHRINACAIELDGAGHFPLLYSPNAWRSTLLAEVPKLSRLLVWEPDYPLPMAVRWTNELQTKRARISAHGKLAAWQFTDAYRVLRRGYDCSALYRQPNLILAGQ